MVRIARFAPPIGVAAVVIVNAWTGLMPGVGFWDTGEFQTVLPIMGTAHPTGYPTYVLLGFLGNILLAPFGEPAFRITVLSLRAVATAAGATVVLVRRLTGSTVIGVATGLGLALTPVVWANATRGDGSSALMQSRFRPLCGTRPAPRALLKSREWFARQQKDEMRSFSWQPRETTTAGFLSVNGVLLHATVRFFKILRFAHL